MSESVTIDPTLYWKLRALTTAHELTVDRCNRQMAESQQKVMAHATACGLDPKQSYALQDEGCCATAHRPVIAPQGE